MKNGKFSRQTKRRFHSRHILMLVSVLLICICVTGATLAYLMHSSGKLTNTFNPSQVTSDVVETFGSPYTTKESVKIHNSGDIPAFVRAAVIFTWRDEQGNIAPYLPGEEYSIEWNYGEGKKWFKSGDYYYYSDVVPAGTSTADALITSIQDVQTKTVNGKVYYLSVEILSSAIQADGVMADGAHPVEEAWDVTYNPGPPATISE